MSRYTVEEIRHVRSLTPITEPWEAEAVDFLLSKLAEAQAELAVARERLGPAGYRVLQEVVELRIQVAEMTRDWDDLRESANRANAALINGASSELRMREALRRYAAAKAYDNVIGELLSADRSWADDALSDNPSPLAKVIGDILICARRLPDGWGFKPLLAAYDELVKGKK